MLHHMLAGPPKDLKSIKLHDRTELEFIITSHFLLIQMKLILKILKISKKAELA